MSDQTKIPPVVKSGNRWEGQIVALRGREMQTNFRVDDITPFLKNSKVWFDIGIPNVTIRGVMPSVAAAENMKTSAYAGSDGQIYIHLVESSFPVAVGHKVVVHFRV